jgi:hypothetical protein
VLHDSLVMNILLLRMLEERRVEDLFLYLSVNPKCGADLGRQALFSLIASSRFERCEQRFDLPMV